LGIIKNINKMIEIKKGMLAKDKISGFTGIVTGYANYITGCDQWLLSPKCEDEKIHTKPESIWFDDGRVEPIEELVSEKDVESDTGKGADMQAPNKG